MVSKKKGKIRGNSQLQVLPWMTWWPWPQGPALLTGWGGGILGCETLPAPGEPLPLQSPASLCPEIYFSH